MQTTFIVRNLTDDALSSIIAMPTQDAYAKLFKWAYGDLKHCVSVKYGSSDAFRDRVEWNGLVRDGKLKSHAMEPRKGYKLFTFIAA
jgi:hypothetical protein